MKLFHSQCMTCFLVSQVKRCRIYAMCSAIGRHTAISFVMSPGIPCLPWRNQTGMHDSSCLSSGFLFYACRLTRVEQTGNNVFQPKEKEEEKRFDLKKIDRRRRTGNFPAFPVPFYCSGRVWNMPTKAEGCLIPVFRLTRSNFWQAVMCNHHWITRTPMGWSNTVRRTSCAARSWNSTKQEKPTLRAGEVSIDEELLASSRFCVLENVEKKTQQMNKGQVKFVNL